MTLFQEEMGNKEVSNGGRKVGALATMPDIHQSPTIIIQT